MTTGGEGLADNSDFALNHSTGADTLGGTSAMGKFVPVSLSDTNPANETASGVNRGAGDKNQ